MTTLVALKANDDIFNVADNHKVTKPKPSNKWSSGDIALDHIIEAGYQNAKGEYLSVHYVKEAYFTLGKDDKSIKDAFILGYIVLKIGEKTDTEYLGITQDRYGKASSILAKKNLTKAVTSPTDEHRTKEEQNWYYAGFMQWGRIRDKAGLPKPDRNPTGPRAKKDKEDDQSINLDKVPFPKVANEGDVEKVLLLLASTMARIVESNPNAWSKEMRKPVDNFRQSVAKLLKTE